MSDTPCGNWAPKKFDGLFVTAHTSFVILFHLTPPPRLKHSLVMNSGDIHLKHAFCELILRGGFRETFILQQPDSRSFDD